jgi:hypothetical protein
MVDQLPDFETVDNKGDTLQESGSVSLVQIAVPAVAGAPISEFLIQCPEDQDLDGRLYVSLDGGTNKMTLYPTGHWGWTPKGQSVTQLTLWANQANVDYEVVINREVN